MYIKDSLNYGGSMHRGYVNIYRKIEDWGWYRDSNTSRVFIHLILETNHRDNVFLGTLIKRGSVAISYDRIADKLGLTRKQVRIAMDHLKKSGEISTKRMSKYLLVTLTNYDLYQYQDEKTSNEGQDQDNLKM